MNRALRFTLLGLVVVVLAGCGGGGGARYSADATKSCIQDQNPIAEVSKEDADYIAQAGAEGGYVVDLFGDIEGTSVNMTFERTENDARRTEASYKVFAGALDYPVTDVLFRKGNVVMSWDAAPLDAERSLIEDCLREGDTS